MLEKIKSFPVNYSLLTFLCFTIKILAFEASFPDAIILLGLGAGYAYNQYLKRFQPYNLDEAVMSDLREVKMALSKMNMVKSVEKTEARRYF